MTTIDFGRHSRDYAAYRPGFPGSFYRKIGNLVPFRDARVLDLATGPGTMALELAARGARVAGLDISRGQIRTAAESSAMRSLDERPHFLLGRAEAIAHRDAVFDLVTAGQCWHWFDGPRAMREVRRVLRPGGILAIAHFSYLADRSAVASDTERLILEFNPTWSMAGSSGIHPEWMAQIRDIGFPLVEEMSYVHDEIFSQEGWRGRIRTCNGVGSGGLPPQEVDRFDAALKALLAEKYPDPMIVEHRVWCVASRKPLRDA